MTPSSLLPEAQIAELRSSLNDLASVVQSGELREALLKLRSIALQPIDLQHLFVNHSFKLPR